MINGKGMNCTQGCLVPVHSSDAWRSMPLGILAVYKALLCQPLMFVFGICKNTKVSG